MKLDRDESRNSAIFEQELLPKIDALFNFAYNLTRSEADANDLVQETYVKAFKAIDSYTEGSNAKAWLFCILKRTYITQYNKRKKQPTQVDYEEAVLVHNAQDASPFSGSVDLREDVFDKELSDEVTIALGSISVAFRTVILLSDIEGFTYDEISKILDIPLNTVRTRLFRARNELKSKLVDYASDAYGIEDKRK